MKLYLVRRWGSHQPGSTISVEDEQQAQWLLDHSFAQRSKSGTAVTDNSVAAGEHGPDPRAGGDGTRRRPVSMSSSDRRENRAVAVAGSPVQYNAGVSRDSNSASSKGGLVDHPADDQDGGDDQGGEAAPASRKTSSRRKAS